jgi:hypothetical protein
MIFFVMEPGAAARASLEIVTQTRKRKARKVVLINVAIVLVFIPVPPAFCFFDQVYPI